MRCVLLKLLGILFAASSVDCNPIRMRADFQPMGLAQPAGARPNAATPDRVLIFHDAAPPGFTLRENELKVEPGFAHRILGTVEVSRERGVCQQPERKQWVAETIRLMAQQEAFAAGANALIYYVSDVPPRATPEQFTDICIAKHSSAARRWFAHGWAVILVESPPANAPHPPSVVPQGTPSTPPAPPGSASPPDGPSTP